MESDDETHFSDQKSIGSSYDFVGKEESCIIEKLSDTNYNDSTGRKEYITIKDPSDINFLEVMIKENSIETLISQLDKSDNAQKKRKRSHKFSDFTEVKPDFDDIPCTIIENKAQSKKYIHRKGTDIEKNDNNIVNMSRSVSQKSKFLKKCHFCDYRTTSNILLIEHLDGSHYGINGHNKCSFCELSFIRHIALKEHINAKHRNQSNGTIDRIHSDSATASIQKNDHLIQIEEETIENMIKTESIHELEEEPVFVKFTEPDTWMELTSRNTQDLASSSEIQLPLVDVNSEFQERDYPDLVFFSSKSAKCQYCTFQTPLNCSLQEHIESSHPNIINPYQCPFCRTRFKGQSALKQHVKVAHESSIQGEKAHKCVHCNYIARSHGNLMNHYRIHNKATYVCSHCSFSSNFKGKFRQHLEDEHMVVEELDCDLCNAPDNERIIINQQLCCAHSVRIMFKCVQCNLADVSRNIIKRHFKKCHPIDF